MEEWEELRGTEGSEVEKKYCTLYEQRMNPFTEAGQLLPPSVDVD